jgi:hypothetical protein
MKRFVLRRSTDGAIFGLIPQLEAMPEFKRVEIDIPDKKAAPAAKKVAPAPAKNKSNTKAEKPVKITETPTAPESAGGLDDLILGLE